MQSLAARDRISIEQYSWSNMDRQYKLRIQGDLGHGTPSRVRKEEKLQVVELEGDKLTGPSKSLCQHVP